MRKKVSYINVFAMLLLIFVPFRHALGQTVRVPGDTPTIAEALLTFAEGRLNHGKTDEPNRIIVTSFGPHVEAFPGIGSHVVDGDEAFVIEGKLSDGMPLILVRRGYRSLSNSALDGCVNVNNGVSVEFRNLVFAAAPLSSRFVHNDMFRFGPGGTKVDFLNCVITALPENAINYVRYSDIPTDLLDGTRNYDKSLIRSGDDAMDLGWREYDSPSPTGLEPLEITISDTVITQQGGYTYYKSGHTPDAINMEPLVNLKLEKGTRITSSARAGVLVAGTKTCRLQVEGSSDSPVIFANNGHINDHEHRGGLVSAGHAELLVSHAVFSGNRLGLGLPTLSWAARFRQVRNPGSPEFNGVNSLDSLRSSPVTINRCIFVNNNDAILNEEPFTVISVLHSTFFGNETAFADRSSEPFAGTSQFEYCIFAADSDQDRAAAFELDTMDTAIRLKDCAVVLEGPQALTESVRGGAEMNQVRTIITDPAFETVDFSGDLKLPSGFLRVTAEEYRLPDGSCVGGAIPCD